MKIIALVLAVVVASPPAVSATSVEAVTFEGLVQAAQQIFVGEVAIKRSGEAGTQPQSVAACSVAVWGYVVPGK